MEDVGKGVFTNTRDENNAAALVVLPELWAPLAKKVKAPLLVAVPACNRMFAMSGADRAMLAPFRKIVETALLQEDHALNGAPLDWTAQGFREWPE